MTKHVSLVGLALAAAAGCGMNASGYLDAGTWTPKLNASALRLSAPALDLVSGAGVPEDDSFWTFDASIQIAGSAEHGPCALNFGYVRHVYSGNSAAGFDFAGATLTGPVHTDADLSLYKFAYEEPQTSGQGERRGGYIGIHVLDFDIKAAEVGGGTVRRFRDSAPMLVFGWRIAYMSDQDLMYYFSVEAMDLGLITIENVKGTVLDTSVGARWMIYNKVALSVGYRQYDARLDMRDDRLDVKMEGVNYSFFMTW